MKQIKIISDKNKHSLKIKKFIKKKIIKNNFSISKLIIVLGGDGFMLKTLKKKINSKVFFLWN